MKFFVILLLLPFNAFAFEVQEIKTSPHTNVFALRGLGTLEKFVYKELDMPQNFKLEVDQHKVKARLTLHF